jgi:hypothetical protein
LVLLSGCGSITLRAIQGSGQPADEKRDVDFFEAVEIQSALFVEVRIDESHSVEIEGDDNLLPVVLTEVDDSTLHVKLPPNTTVRPVNDLRVSVTAPTIRSVEASGASTVGVAELHSDELAFSAIDASRMQVIKAHADEIILNVSGTSELSATGRASNVKVDVSEASRLDAKELVADHVEVNTSDASTARVHGSKSVSGRASGASKVQHVGGADKVEVKTSGDSNVYAG